MYGKLIEQAVYRRVQEAFLDAAADDQAWLGAIERAASAFGAEGGAILPIVGRGPGLYVTAGVQDVFEAYARDGWFSRDFRYNGLDTLLSKGILVDQDIIQPDEMKSNPLYQELLAPHGFKWFAGLLINSGEGVWGLTLQRRAERGAFENHEQHDLLALSRIISHAATVATGFEASKVDGYLAASDAAGRPSLVIDGKLKVLQFNEAAASELGKSIDVKAGRLAIKSISQRNLEGVLRTHVFNVPSNRGKIELRTQSGTIGLAYEKVSSRGTSRLTPLKAIITFETERTLPLRKAIDLTRQEQALIDRLGKFRNLVEVADDLGISHETVRSQIKGIFAKTGTRSQVELLLYLRSREI